MKSRSSMTKRKWTEYGFVAAVLAYPLALFVIFYVIVNFNSFLLAFQKVDIDFNYTFVGWENFKEVWADIVNPSNATLRLSFSNSFLRFILITGIGMPLNILFGYMIYRKMRATGVFRIIVMLPSIISAMLMALMFQKLMYALPSMMKTVGVEFPKMMSDPQYVFGMTVFYSLWTGFGGSVIMYPNIMGSIDPEIIESSKIDGCSPLQEIRYIIIPLIMPTITTYMVTGVAGIFNDMGPNYVFWENAAPAQASNIGYLIYARVLRDGSVQYGYTSALGMMCTLIAFPMTLFVKYFMEKVDPQND